MTPFSASQPAISERPEIFFGLGLGQLIAGSSISAHLLNLALCLDRLPLP
jgi:hypothetical protein